MRPITRVLTATTALLALAAAPAAAAGDFTIKGAGNGHGVGMSQYGAQQAAAEGRTAAEILGHYYTGTSLGSRPPGFVPKIGVAPNQARLQVVIRGASAVVKAGGFTYDGPKTEPGEVWTVVPRSTSGGWRCQTTSSGGANTTGACPVFNPDTGGSIEVRRWDGGKFVKHHAYGGAAVDAVVRTTAKSPGLIDGVVQVPMEQYLYGIAEVPYSWGTHALRAQAIAARSFATHRLLRTKGNISSACSCHLYDSQQDQVFKGTTTESPSSSFARWKDAVDTTFDTGQAVILSPGSTGTVDGVVQAFYSSSSSGRTESKHESQSFSSEVWPYMVSVDDPWTLRNASNPFRSWTATVPTQTVASKVGFDTVTSIDVTSRSESGAALQVRFRGTKNGQATEALWKGSDVRIAFGLRSTHIDVVYLPPFTDDDGNVHEQSIVWLASEGITNGCNPPTNDRFCPNDPVTRGQMAAFLVRTLGLAPGPGGKFTDTAGHTFENDIDALRASGITVGCNPPANDRFCPNEAVTRAQMASFLVRARDHAGTSLSSTNKDFFVDDKGNVHEQAINRIRAANITSGCNPPAGDRFCPSDRVTRAQMASFLRNAFG